MARASAARWPARRSFASLSISGEEFGRVMPQVYNGCAAQARGPMPRHPHRFSESEIGWPRRSDRRTIRLIITRPEPEMTKAYYSTVLDYPLDTVWTLIRDFNNYPAY